MKNIVGLIIGFVCVLNAFGQNSAFTYQGRLNDGSAPASGFYDLQFALFATSSGGSPLAGPVTNSATAISNGLFTVTLDFGPGVFSGADRWLEIAVAPSGTGSFTTLSPRQQITATPYALRSLEAATVPVGTVTSSMLAPGAAASNLLSSGISGVARDGVVLSELENSSNLFNQGYVRLGKVDLVPESWRTLSNGPPLGDFQAVGRRDHAAVWTGTEMIVWGGTSSLGPLNSGARYNPVTDSWTHMSQSNAPSPQSQVSIVWTGTNLIVWGNSGPVRGGRYDPVTDSWLPLNEANAPSARTGHSAIWTGTHLIIWGGATTNGFANNGARYDPATNGWSPVQPTGAPAVRGQHSTIWTGIEMIIWGGIEQHSCGLFCVSTTNYNDGARYNPASNSWQPMTTVSSPSKRYAHSAVWTGTEMIIWGGLDANGSFGFATNLNSGARYNPTLNQWTATTAISGAPLNRANHQAHWTGSRMIIWGGLSDLTGTNMTDGAQYNPANNTWTAINNSGAPPARVGYNSVWTGSQMLLFGGDTSPVTGAYSDIGYRYTATNDTWSVMSPGGDPPERADHTAVWTGTEMLVFGGVSTESNLRSGGRLNPSLSISNMWSVMASTNGPSARSEHTAVWTGTEMIIWGGFNGTQPRNTGARFNPVLNAWTPVSTVGAPTARGRHVAAWTGNQMVIWGGFDGTNFLATGGRYNPAADTWQTVSGAGAPAARADAVAVGTGTELIVWGGQSVSGGVTNFLNTGGRYNPSANTWQTLPATDAPSARFGHTAVWTGNEMIVWGGETQIGKTNSGARYFPVANLWTPLPMPGAPSIRAQHTAVWAGSQMLVWGGFDGTNELSSGARYDLGRDAWNAMTSVGAPPTRQRHSAVWTGTEMIVWGGQRYVGGLTNYLADTYGYAPSRTLYLYLRP